MFRTACLAVLTLLTTVASSQAAITIAQQLSATQPAIPSPSGPLIAYDVKAMSDDGTVLIGVNNPTTTPLPIGGMGLHQVWTPIINLPTPTRREQIAAGVLWSDTWRAYDSHWFFDAEMVGLPFTETNTGDGAVLPANGFGVPETGFGHFGYTPPSASKGYTIASGLQGTTINLGQFVLKAGELVLLSLGILDTTGGNTRFDNVCIGMCPPPQLFEVYDFILGGVPRSMVVAGPLSTNATIPDIDWSLVSLLGPDGAASGATVDPITGVFSWQPTLHDPGGIYFATIQGVNAGTPLGTDTGLLRFILPPVPEPSSITLLGLAMVGFAVTRRR